MSLLPAVIAIINAQNMLKIVIIYADSPICTDSLNKLRKQQLIDEIVYEKKLMTCTVRKLAVVDGEMMIGKNTDEVLGLNYTYRQEHRGSIGF